MRRVALILLMALISTVSAQAQSIACPFVADVQTGEFSNSSSRYKCFKSAASAKNAGFIKGANPSKSRTWSGSADFKTEVFYLKKGSTVSYSCPSDEYFSIKIYQASNNKYLDLLISHIGAIDASTRTYDSGAVYFEIGTTGCAWTVTVR